MRKTSVSSKTSNTFAFRPRAVSRSEPKGFSMMMRVHPAGGPSAGRVPGKGSGQQPLAGEIVQVGDEAIPREVAGRPEDHDRAGLGYAAQPQPLPQPVPEQRPRRGDAGGGE